MASLQLRGESWRCLFVYKKKQHAFTIGKVDEIEARGVCAKVEYLLMRLKQKLLDLPSGCDIVTFLRYDGNPPEEIVGPEPKPLSMKSLLEQYLETHSNGTLEPRTLKDIEQHFNKWNETLGTKFEIQNLSLPDLQKHVNRRTGEPNKVSAATAKKEVVTLRTVWNWGKRFGLLEGDFPYQGLRYPKIDQKPPFMTMGEIERQIEGGGDAAVLWDCLFLTTGEVKAMLAHVEAKSTLPWLHPMICFAAQTGARRSEILRVEVRDVDFEGGMLQIRERKRVRGQRSTRRVPLTPHLSAVLQKYLEDHPGCPSLFCNVGVLQRSKKRSQTTGHKDQKTRPKTLGARLETVTMRSKVAPAPITIKEASHHFKHVMKDSKWEVLKGWHVLRHSFISNCVANGIDQRYLDRWVGHTTSIRERYIHLIPSNEQQVIQSVFGD